MQRRGAQRELQPGQRSRRQHRGKLLGSRDFSAAHGAGYRAGQRIARAQLIADEQRNGARLHLNHHDARWRKAMRQGGTTDHGERGGGYRSSHCEEVG